MASYNFLLTRVLISCSVMIVFQPCLALGNVEPDRRTCSEKIQEFSPMLNLDLNRVEGLWFIRRVGWVNSSHVRGANFLACPAQYYKLQTNSNNVEIVFGEPNNKSNVDYGLAQITQDRPAYWSDVKFLGSPNRLFQEVVLSTDYNNHLIFYECEMRGDGSRMDFIALRSRKKSLNEEEMAQFTRFAEGYGWPKENIINLAMEPWCYPNIKN